MAQRAAIVTGASSGIGLAIAHVLGEEGHALTVAARRAEKLAAAAEELRAKGYDVNEVAAQLGEEDEIKRVVTSHRERFGRCDVLVNNAGVGMGEPVGSLTTKKVDIQIDTNLRAIILFYRECLEMLQAAGAEHRRAQVINTASIAGKSGQPWVSVYSATKFAVVGFTQSMHKELSAQGIKSTALCPGLVATPMTDWAKEAVTSDQMIQTSDVAETVRLLLKLSPACIVPEVQFIRPEDGGAWGDS